MASWHLYLSYESLHMRWNHRNPPLEVVGSGIMIFTMILLVICVFLSNVTISDACMRLIHQAWRPYIIY
jgi:hypothetical protein